MTSLLAFPEIYVPTFRLQVDSAPVPPEIARSVLDVRVTLHRRPPSQFGFRVNDPKLELIEQAGGIFSEGTRIELELGYVGNIRKLITGTITALSADFPENGPATLQVDGFDLLHPLTRGTTYRRFGQSDPGNGVADSDIVSQIAAEANLSADVDATPVRTEPRVQNHVTNVRFLEELAEANGYELWVEGDTLSFKRLRPPSPGSPVRLEWRKTLSSFSARLTTAGQVEAVEIRGWDPIQKQGISARSERSGAGVFGPSGLQAIARGSGGRSERTFALGASVASGQEAQTMADRLMAEQQGDAFVATGSLSGRPELDAGSEVELVGVSRFSGTYGVEEVTHSLDGSGYRTTFRVRPR